MPLLLPLSLLLLPLPLLPLLRILLLLPLLPHRLPNAAAAAAAPDVVAHIADCCYGCYIMLLRGVCMVKFTCHYKLHPQIQGEWSAFSWQWLFSESYEIYWDRKWIIKNALTVELEHTRLVLSSSRRVHSYFRPVQEHTCIDDTDDLYIYTQTWVAWLIFFNAQTMLRESEAPVAHALDDMTPLRHTMCSSSKAVVERLPTGLFFWGYFWDQTRAQFVANPRSQHYIFFNKPEGPFETRSLTKSEGVLII